MNEYILIDKEGLDNFNKELKLQLEKKFTPFLNSYAYVTNENVVHYCQMFYRYTPPENNKC